MRWTFLLCEISSNDIDYSNLWSANGLGTALSLFYIYGK